MKYERTTIFDESLTMKKFVHDISSKKQILNFSFLCSYFCIFIKFKLFRILSGKFCFKGNNFFKQNCVEKCNLNLFYSILFE